MGHNACVLWLGVVLVPYLKRLQFACMNAHSKILKHTDRGGWVQRGHRIHVPLVVGPGA